MKRISTIGLAVAGSFFATPAVADEFSFDIGASYGRTQYEGSSTTVFEGHSFYSDGTLFVTGESDTDTLTLFGTWYFAGLSDDNGPRARAAFVDRASAVSALYSHQEESSSYSIVSSVPEISSGQREFDESADFYAVAGRLVGRESGWFAEAAVTESDLSFGSKRSAWSLGVGKYLFDTTALSVSAGNVDERFGYETDIYALGFTHLGQMGQSWQYALDLAYEHERPNTDFVDDADNWSTRLALYPTRNLEFGIAYADSERRIGDPTGSSIEGFASWFITPKIELGARYRVDEFDRAFTTASGSGIVESTSNDDQDSFGVTFNMRF